MKTVPPPAYNTIKNCNIPKYTYNNVCESDNINFEVLVKTFPINNLIIHYMGLINLIKYVNKYSRKNILHINIIKQIHIFLSLITFTIINTNTPSQLLVTNYPSFSKTM